MIGESLLVIGTIIFIAATAAMLVEVVRVASRQRDWISLSLLLGGALAIVGLFLLSQHR